MTLEAGRKRAGAHGMCGGFGRLTCADRTFAQAVFYSSERATVEQLNALLEQLVPSVCAW